MDHDENDATLAAYDRGVDIYVDASPGEACLPLLSQLMSAVPPPARVLEIGSGPGHDARRLVADGYTMCLTDASDGFLSYLHASGWPGAIRYDFDHDDPPAGDWDAIYANAVLHHLRRDRLGPALSRLRRGLRPGSVFVASVKSGRTDNWSSAKLNDPRWFTYWLPGDLRGVLNASGWQIDVLAERTGRNDDWLDFVAHS